MHRICESLAEAGFDVQLVGRQLNDSIEFKSQIFDTKRLACFFNRGFLFYAEYNLRLLFYLLFQKTDIINSVDLDTLAAGRITSFLKGSRFTYDAHELFTGLSELNGRPLKKSIWSFIETLFVRGNIKCYTVNMHVAEKLTKKTGKEFNIIYNYPTKKLSKTASDIQSPIQLVYQGVLNIGRGLPELISAIGSNNKYSLHIIGKGDIESKIKELAKEYSNVEMHGFVEASNLHETTSQFDIGLNLLTDTSDNYVYSSANKYFDYIMAGLPVISMDFPEYKKVNDEYNVGILLKDLSTDSIIHAIETISGNYEMYSLNCAKASSALNWSSEAKKLIEIYGSPTL